MIKLWNGKTCSCKICCDVVLIWLVGIFAQKLKVYQITNAFVYSELKLVARVTAKSLPKSGNSNLFKTVYAKQYIKIFCTRFFNLKHLISF